MERTEARAQKIKITELKFAAKSKEDGYQALEKSYKDLQDDHQAITTLLEL